MATRKVQAKKPAAKKPAAKKPAASVRKTKSSSQTTGADQVDAYMKDLEHPLKAEIEAVRTIILGANKKVAERVKWNAPSFYYKEDIAAFHPRARDCVHVVFVFPRGTMPSDRFGFLEGDYVDRRMARFRDMADVQANKAGLVRLVNHWVRAMDEVH
ncbi:DUF1801 domain-containing protein [Archangium violaceum]|uniref:DUF1801 domain-containing protein n=1 Tax=Archangium violaceum TaxID=83451 RepID=UPI00194DEFC2|nr:DUF1801 domain-containing protein [Archangium violaceum]QRN92801.1 DUF1801 domain-containing protein [Archangium violaceum]